MLPFFQDFVEQMTKLYSYFSPKENRIVFECEAETILIADVLAKTAGFNTMHLTCRVGVDLYAWHPERLIVSVIEKENVVKAEGKYFLNLSKFHYNTTNVWESIGWFPNLDAAKDMIKKHGQHRVRIQKQDRTYSKL